MLVGIGVILLGYVLMIGGGSAPDLTTTYPEDTLYGFQRTVLAPLLVLIGLGIQIFAIFAKNDAPVEITPPENSNKAKAKRTATSTSRNKKRKVAKSTK